MGALALAFNLLAVVPASAQSPGADDATAPARFVRSDDVLMYVEFDGIDAHADAWGKTAASKILNDTPTGAMLEDLTKQLLARAPLGAVTPDEVVLAGKHLFRAGFVAATNVAAPTDGKQRAVGTFVIRKAFSNKDVRPIVARMLQRLSGPNGKPTSVVRAGHKMVSGQVGKATYFWWVEESKKEDLILLTCPAGAEDFALECIEGKAPSMLANAERTALLKKSAEGFERTGLGFLDVQAAQSVGRAGGGPPGATNSSVRLIDVVGGFQGDALMTVTRFFPKDPAQVTKALSQTFDRASLPSFPANSYAWMAFAANMKSVPAQLRQDPQQGPAFEKAAAELKEKTKLRLDEDIFGQLGPKVMMSIAPSKAAENSGGGGGLGGLAALAKLGMGAGGADAVPKVALLVDVADSKAFGKTLDEFIGFINRDIKAEIAKKMEAAGAGAGGPGGPGGPGRRGGAAGNLPPTPEFRPVTSGEGKSYVLYLPPDLAKSMPKDLRPAIRLGGKQLAVATSADAARQALEGKGNYAPPADLLDGFNRLPSQLNGLIYLDTRSFTPDTLAALPGKIQQVAAILGAIQARQPGATPAAPLTFQIEPSKLPTADAIRSILFPSVYAIDRDGGAVRITSRAPFPPVTDPSLLLGLMLPAIQAARNAALRQQGIAPPTGPTDGFFDVPPRDGPPSTPPSGTPPPGGRPGGRPGRGMDRGGSERPPQ